jgi:tetratricopeptide (TPR) repeat protein
VFDPETAGRAILGRGRTALGANENDAASLDGILAEVDALASRGRHLPAVAALKRALRLDLAVDAQHELHLRLATLYRKMNLEEEANREVLTVAAHWVDEGRIIEARNLLASNEALLPGGVGMLGDIPSDPAAAREALAELLRTLRHGKGPGQIAGIRPGARIPSEVPASGETPVSSPGGRPRKRREISREVPMEAAGEVSIEMPIRNPPLASSMDARIAELEANVRANREDLKSHLKLADLFSRAGRKRDAAEHYTVVAALFEVGGFPHKAIAAYKQALLHDPARRNLHSRLGDLYTHLGMSAEASAEFAKADPAAR